MTTMTQPDTVDATKNFQPTPETRMVVSFHVVCAAGENTSNTSIAYVTAVQDGYTLKKSGASGFFISSRGQPSLRCATRAPV
jgi:hypothetical protein